MLCSILISNFNKSKYLEKCLSSVKNQTYDNIEIIFSDNYSTDDSIIKASKFSNIKILKTKRLTNSPALNQIDVILKAFEVSKGDYIFLLDSDDFFEKKKIEKIIKFKSKNNCELIFDVPRLYIDNYNIKSFKTKSSYNLFRSWPIIFPTSTISFTRKFFLNFRNFLYEKNYEKLEIDTRLNIFSHIDRQRVLLDQILTNYNQNTDGIMSKYKKFNKNWWERRMQAHQYFQKICDIKNLNCSKNFDYYFTRLINKIY